MEKKWPVGKEVPVYTNFPGEIFDTAPFNAQMCPIWTINYTVTTYSDE